MSSDHQYTATGPAIIGFQTDGTRIDRGAEIFGNEFGIRGTSFTGAGVIGESTNDPGVEGRGETGIVGRGLRGPGVEGFGGDRSGIAEAGVVGLGARKDVKDNAKRQLHGPGVIGVGGAPPDARSKLEKEEHVVGSVGVFGQGAEAEVQRVGGAIHGPRTPGAGVVGRGGKSIPIDGQGDRTPAPGVIGFSGATDFLFQVDSGARGDVGVYGVGGTGVTGTGIKGPGVEGHGSSGDGFGGSRGVIGPGVVGQGGSGTNPMDPQSTVHGVGVIGIAGETPLPHFAETVETGVYGAGRDGVKGAGSEGRGGVFKSERSAQIQLVPAKRSPPQRVERESLIPTVIPDPNLQGLELPKDGRVGDLISVVDNDEECSLWFCVEDKTGMARWAQVLLGRSFKSVI